MDKARRIYTLPVVLGERISRYTVLCMFILQYLTTIYLIITQFYTLALVVVLLALPSFLRVLPMFRKPKPINKPAGFPDVWPNYFVAAAFIHNRRFGLLYVLGLILDTLIKGLLNT